jgi:predicted ATPase
MTNTQRIGGRYEILEVIGDGGMGMVYRGRDNQSGSTVAIKALKEEIIQSSPILLERFAREGEMLRELDHPNIVKVLATINEESAHYLVMEYVGGGSLKDVLRRNPQLPIKQVLRIALGMADALTRTHELGIIHRDVKLSNVLLTDGGTPRLTDFGVAQSNESEITKTGALMGTLVYLSPEAFLRQPLDERTDIWSFGVSLYELLTGNRPFRGEDMNTVMQAVLEGEMLPLERLRPDAPLSLVDLVYRMLERNRYARIGSMREVGAELEHILRSLPATSPRLQLAAALANVAGDEDNRFAISLPPIGQDAGLPPELTPFVGRGQERRELKQLLHDPVKRLITICGPSGVGKSRLAVEIARGELSDFPHGVFYINLDGVRHLDTLIDRLNARLGCQPRHHTNPRTALLAFLRFKAVLLILDHLDDLNDAQGLLLALQKQAPQVTVLGTSRRPLTMMGESTVVLGGMEYRTWRKVRTAREYAITDVFLNRMHIDRPSYELSAAELDAFNRIIARCKGLPLAVTLAAGAAQTLTLQAVADALTEHQLGEFLDANFVQAVHAADANATPQPETTPGVHAAVRTAYDVLNATLEAEAQHMLMRLSLFRQSVARDGALAVSEGELETLRLLQRRHLIDRRPDGRFEMHPAVRQLAAEALSHQPGIEETASAEFQSYFAGFGHRRKYDLRGFRQWRALREFRRELPNLEQAWVAMVSMKSIRDMMRLAVPLGHYYWLEGSTAAGARTFSHALELTDTLSEGASAYLASNILTRYGAFLAFSTGRSDEAHNILVQGLNLARHRHNLPDVAFANYVLGLMAEDREASFTHLEEALQAATNAPDEFMKTRALLALSEWYARDGRLDKFDELNQRAQNTAHQQGDHFGEIEALHSLATFASTQHEHRLAIQAERDLLQYYTALGDRQNVTQTQLNIGYSAFKRGRLTQAHEALQAAATMAQQMNDLVSLGAAWGLATLVLSIKDQRDDAPATLDDLRTLTRETHHALVGARYGLAAAHVALALDRTTAAQRALVSGLLHAQRANQPTELALYVLLTAILQSQRDDLHNAARLLAVYFRQDVALHWLDRDERVAGLKARLSAELPEDTYRELVAATRDVPFDAVLMETQTLLTG